MLGLLKTILLSTFSPPAYMLWLVVFWALGISGWGILPLPLFLTLLKWLLAVHSTQPVLEVEVEAPLVWAKGNIACETCVLCLGCASFMPL